MMLQGSSVCLAGINGRAPWDTVQLAVRGACSTCDFNLGVALGENAAYLQVWHLHHLAPATVPPERHAAVHFQDVHSASAQSSASDHELCHLH